MADSKAKPKESITSVKKKLTEARKEIKALQESNELLSNTPVAEFPVQIVPLKSITVVYNNNRRTGGKKAIAQKHSSSFQSNIEEIGIIEPLIVEQGEEGYVLRNGYRRTYSLEQSIAQGKPVKNPKGYEDENEIFVPVQILEKDMALSHIIKVEMGSNMSEPWTAETLVGVAKELKDAGYSNKEISESLSINETQVSGYIQVAESPTAMRKLRENYATETASTFPIAITELIRIVKGVNGSDTTSEEEREARLEGILNKATSIAEGAGATKVTRDVAKAALEEEGLVNAAKKPSKAAPITAIPKKKISAEDYMVRCSNVIQEVLPGTKYAVALETLWDAFAEARAKGLEAGEAAQSFIKSIQQEAEWTAQAEAEAAETSQPVEDGDVI